MSIIKRILSKVRKNTSYQWSEYIVYDVIKNYPVKKNYNDIISHFDKRVHKNYYNDLLIQKKNTVLNYYNNFYSCYSLIDEKNTTQEVTLLGRKPSSVEYLNKVHSGSTTKNTSKIKSDILIKRGSTYIGISVKSSSRDTLTNYSIYKMLSIEEVSYLKEIQNNIILNNPDDSTLFLNYDNIQNDYHKELNNIILKNKEKILLLWYNYLFGDLPYEVYTFDGVLLTNKKPKLEDLSLLHIYNPASSIRGAAKLFYIIVENDIPIYKWEIRWKGDIKKSPQILTYNFKFGNNNGILFSK